jgi:hypothetical protein
VHGLTFARCRSNTRGNEIKRRSPVTPARVRVYVPMTIIVYFGRPRRVSFLRSVATASQPANGMQTHTFYLKAAATTPINIVSLFSVSADGERIKVLARLVYITRVVMDGPSHAGTHASRVNTINNSFVFCKLTLIKIRRVRE